MKSLKPFFALLFMLAPLAANANACGDKGQNFDAQNQEIKDCKALVGQPGSVSGGSPSPTNPGTIGSNGNNTPTLNSTGAPCPGSDAFSGDPNCNPPLTPADRNGFNTDQGNGVPVDHGTPNVSSVNPNIVQDCQTVYVTAKKNCRNAICLSNASKQYSACVEGAR
jgi:hypothetical protein